MPRMIELDAARTGWPAATGEMLNPWLLRGRHRTHEPAMRRAALGSASWGDWWEYDVRHDPAQAMPYAVYRREWPAQR